MASRLEVNTRVFDRLNRHLTPPVPIMVGAVVNPDYTALLEDYLVELQSFTGAELSEGCRQLIRNWRYKRWPNIAEICAACMAVHRETHPRPAPAPRRSEPPGPKLSAAERRVMADKLKRLAGVLGAGGDIDEHRVWIERGEQR